MNLEVVLGIREARARCRAEAAMGLTSPSAGGAETKVGTVAGWSRTCVRSKGKLHCRDQVRMNERESQLAPTDQKEAPNSANKRDRCSRWFRWIWSGVVDVVDEQIITTSPLDRLVGQRVQAILDGGRSEAVGMTVQQEEVHRLRRSSASAVLPKPKRVTRPEPTPQQGGRYRRSTYVLPYGVSTVPARGGGGERSGKTKGRLRNLQERKKAANRRACVTCHTSLATTQHEHTLPSDLHSCRPPSGS